MAVAEHATGDDEPDRRTQAVAAVVAAFVLVGVALLVTEPGDPDESASAITTATPPPTTIAPVPLRPVTPATAPTAPVPNAPPTTTAATPAFDGLVDPGSSGDPWSPVVEGVLTFRGNPTRSYHGEGPVPADPEIAWRYPSSGGLCSESTVGDETKTWCGTGWTGQPAVWEQDGRTWMAFGAYDRRIHVLDVETGEPVFEPFPTGDIIKGSVTIDPDGYPLLYSGSRDNFYRVLSFDQGELVELWRLSADEAEDTRWNNDWDGAGLIVDDHLYIGGENSIFHVVELRRAFDENGLVTVDPELVFDAPGYDDELIAAVGNNVSIESSVAISGDTAYFANSGGLVQGWDVSGVGDGVDPVRTFRFWAGDDIDASIVVDEDGFLYVGAEYERGLERAREVGQIMKLDPTVPDDPLVWSVDDSSRIDGGVFATPALHRDLVIVPTDGGRLLGIDRDDGAVRWTVTLPGPLWMSPTIVDDVLLQGDCAGTLHAFDVSDTTVEPPPLWQVELGGCLESSPSVWRGSIVVGSRDGGVYRIADPGELSPAG